MRATGALVLLALNVLCASLLAGRPAQAVTCDVAEFEQSSFSMCRVTLGQDDLRLFLYDDQGAPYGQFSTLNADLAQEDKTLAFAMNAGMYHDDRAPVGHYIEDGQELMRVISSAGPGNFGLLPNGVFCIGADSAQVIETGRYIAQRPDCRYATQSGPMLVIDGALHPRFLPDSTSRYVRNGVGTSDDGRIAVFAISDSAVTFDTFGRFFRDHLGLNQALFLDGNISRLHAPQLDRSDFGRWMGPMVGVVADLPAN